MNGSILLDTNIIVALFEQEPIVLERLSNAEHVFVPIIALGELHYGALKSARVEPNLSRLDELAEKVPILPCDKNTASYYGRIRNQLHLKGRPIPENDIWIASIGLQHGIPIATRDKHFSEIDGLLLEYW
jgi:tRNA(fMet)-specific endonuclease VapC